MYVLAIGLPTVIGSFALICLIVDQIVVSVGPNIFHASLSVSVKYCFNLLGRDSPPQRIFILSSFLQPIEKSAFHVTGVACIIVGFILLISSFSFSIFFCVALLQI